MARPRNGMGSRQSHEPGLDALDEQRLARLVGEPHLQEPRLLGDARQLDHLPRERGVHLDDDGWVSEPAPIPRRCPSAASQ